MAPGVSAGLTDENHLPEVAEQAVSRSGDIWCMEGHRLVCGDCTDEAIVKALLHGQQPQLMVTDPPYGVQYDPAWRHRLGINKSEKNRKIRNDERADWAAAWSLFPGQIAYVWHGALHAATVAESLTRTGFTIRAQIIWAKERLVMGRGDYHWQHEPAWYAVRSKGHWTGGPQCTASVGSMLNLLEQHSRQLGGNPVVGFRHRSILHPAAHTSTFPTIAGTLSGIARLKRQSECFLVDVRLSSLSK